MIIVGIPTLNEADNIGKLVEKIDKYSVELGQNIVIINSDSNSDDQTSKIFLNTQTFHSKISLTSVHRGKGYNVRNIFDYCLDHFSHFEGVVLIDGDVISLDKTWLQKMYLSIREGNDLVVPNYARKFFEGNATNHFIYPILVKLFEKDVPYQCISGDLGFSKKLVQELIHNCNWHRYSKGYGIDIFLTLTALLKSYKTKEIDLEAKIHKRSFEKIEKIFLEVSQSFFETLTDNFSYINRDKYQLVFESHTKRFVASNDKPSIDEIEKLKIRALHLLDVVEDKYPQGIEATVWHNKLAESLKKLPKFSSKELTKNLLPYYLLRVYNYLKFNNFRSASFDLNEMTQSIKKCYCNKEKCFDLYNSH